MKPAVQFSRLQHSQVLLNPTPPQMQMQSAKTTHRPHPNQLWAQLADQRLTAGLIADAHHLPADTLTAMVRAKGPGRSFLVSDAAALAGSPSADGPLADLPRPVTALLVPRPEQPYMLGPNEARALAAAASREPGCVAVWLDPTLPAEVAQAVRSGLAAGHKLVTDRKAAERAAAFMAEASGALNTSLDYDATLEAIGALVVPRLADWCFVDLVEADGGFERAVAAHGMSEYAETPPVDGEIRRDQRGQLLRDVGVHAVAVAPGRLRRVHVKPGAEAEIVGPLRVVRHAFAARRSVWRHHYQPMLRRIALGAGLGREVLLGAGQP